MGRVRADLVVKDAGQLLTLAGPVPRRGRWAGHLGIIEGGALASREGRIVWVGRTGELAEKVEPTTDCEVIDAEGRVVMPGFVDCHTHVLYAGSRADEYWMRTRGLGYREIGEASGGILRTVRETNEASEHEIIRQTLRRLDGMLAQGTTTLEVKSGYSLTASGEVRLLRIISRLSRMTPVGLIPTLLAAHWLPEAYEGRRDAYLRMVIEEILPVVAKEGLARFNDVFVEEGAFTPQEGRRILEAGKGLGLRPKVHAEELSHSGGAALAAQVGAASADHLVFCTQEDMRSLSASLVTAVLLPASSLGLRIGRHADGRALVEAGVPVALGTDCSPAFPTLSMQSVISLACSLNGLTLDEALVAATINAAYAVGEAENVGSLEPGKMADFLVLDVTDYRNLGYGFGENIVREVYKGGRLVASGGGAVY